MGMWMCALQGKYGSAIPLRQPRANHARENNIVPPGAATCFDHACGVIGQDANVCATTALPNPKQEVCGHEEPAASAGDA